MFKVCHIWFGSRINAFLFYKACCILVDSNQDSRTTVEADLAPQEAHDALSVSLNHVQTKPNAFSPRASRSSSSKVVVVSLVFVVFLLVVVVTF